MDNLKQLAERLKCDGELQTFLDIIRQLDTSELPSDEWPILLEPYIKEPYKLDFIGSGAFSAVYDCPWNPDSVIKIGLGMCLDGRLEQDGGLLWNALCHDVKDTNWESVHLPDIRDFIVLPYQCMYLVESKKYSDLPNWNIWEGVQNDMRSLIEDNDPSSEEYERLWIFLADYDLIRHLNDISMGNILYDHDINKWILNDPLGVSPEQIEARINPFLRSEDE